MSILNFLKEKFLKINRKEVIKMEFLLGAILVVLLTTLMEDGKATRRILDRLEKIHDILCDRLDMPDDDDL